MFHNREVVCKGRQWDIGPRQYSLHNLNIAIDSKLDSAERPGWKSSQRQKSQNACN